MAKLRGKSIPLQVAAKELNFTPLGLRGAMRVLKIKATSGRSAGNRMALLLDEEQMNRLRAATQ